MHHPIAHHISWNDFIQWPELDYETTFEHLCWDFMRYEYGLTETPVPHNSNYPWSEWFPVEGADGWYWFQAKFMDDPFNSTNNKIISSCKNICDNTELLMIFTKWEYPPFNTEDQKKTYKHDDNKSTYCIDKPIKLFEWWEWYRVEHLEKEKGFKQVKFWCGNKFLDRIKEYPILLRKYFGVQRVKQELYRSCWISKELIDGSALQEDLNKVEQWFSGNPALFSNDLWLAQVHQKNYSTKKLTYVSNDLIADDFDDLEKAIADYTFEIFPFKSIANLDAYLEVGKKLVRDENEIMNKYNAEINEMISNLDGVFVNFWTQWKCRLDYISSGIVNFINTRTI